MPRFPEFNQHIGMKNVQLEKDLKFASNVVFNNWAWRATWELCIHYCPSHEQWPKTLYDPIKAPEFTKKVGNQIWVLNNQVKVVQRRTTLVEARRIRERLRSSDSKEINNFLVQYFVYWCSRYTFVFQYCWKSVIIDSLSVIFWQTIYYL